ncbi:MAG TPA: hypothetical protein VGA95_09175 [Thermodesulfobacteriota bacterium]
MKQDGRIACNRSKSPVESHRESADKRNQSDIVYKIQEVQEWF